MRFPKLPLDREQMIDALRSMASDLENGGAFTKGSMQFRTVRLDQVTAVFSITGERKKDNATTNA